MGSVNNDRTLIFGWTIISNIFTTLCSHTMPNMHSVCHRPVTHQVDSVTAVVEFSSFAESLTSALLTDPGFWRKELTELALQLLCACQLSVHLGGELISLLHTLHQIIPAHAEVNAHITVLFSAYYLGGNGRMRNNNLYSNQCRLIAFIYKMQIQKCIIFKEKMERLVLYFLLLQLHSQCDLNKSSPLIFIMVLFAQGFLAQSDLHFSEAPSVSSRLSDCALSNTRNSRLSKWSWESPCYC